MVSGKRRANVVANNLIDSMEGKAKHHLMRILWLKRAVVIPLQIASSRCRDSASGVDFHTRTMIGRW
jgi:hypothetical protein